MTKFEWERQLKKGISGLPKAEQQRVLDYYNELFADKIDAGLREQYIISEFGNPYDVANKILVDFYNDGKENPAVDEYIYSTSDEIDEAFDDAPTSAAVETPKRKTWTERREDRREAHKVGNDEGANAAFSDIVEYDTGKDTINQAKKKSKGTKSASGLIVLICILIYCVLGACFNKWHPTWLIFLVVPCAISLIEAINRRNWRVFAYPLFATSLFLSLGFFANKWHPAWIVFITIPIYYVLGDFITKNADGSKKAENNKKSNDTKSAQKRVESEGESKSIEVNSKVHKRRSNTNVVTMIAKILLAICLVGVAVFVWWSIIGLFVGGIGMIIGGIGCIAGAFIGTSVNWLLAGAGIAVLGLGLICAFGMVALFKPCINMCKAFIKTIKNSFDSKEKA